MSDSRSGNSGITESQDFLLTWESVATDMGGNVVVGYQRDRRILKIISQDGDYHSMGLSKEQARDIAWLLHPAAREALGEVVNGAESATNGDDTYVISGTVYAIVKAVLS